MSRLALLGSFLLLGCGGSSKEIAPITREMTPEIEIKGHESLIYRVLFTLDGQRLISAGEHSEKGAIRIWEVATGKQIGQIDDASGMILSLAITPDGSKLASGNGRDAIIRLWDLASYKPVGSFDAPVLPKEADSIIKSDQGQTLVSQVKDISFHRDGNLFACAGPSHLVRIWERKGNKLVSTLKGHPSTVTAIAFQPDGKQLVSGGGSGDTVHEPGILKVWDTTTWKETNDLKGHKSMVTSIAFSEDGKSFASSDWHGEIRFWDLPTGKEVALIDAEPKGEPEPTIKIAFSPDGNTLAVAGENSLRLIEVGNPQKVKFLKGHNGAFRSIAFSPNGKMLAGAGYDKIIRVWKLSD